MPYISDRLRQPDGCPWDREQTHASLRKHLLEETYEVYDALEGGATPALAEELGDLLLQVVLHAQLAAEAGVFDLADVQAAIAPQDRAPPPARLRRRGRADGRRREPAVGADQGRRARGAAGTCRRDGDDARQPAPPKSALDGISASMPALAASQEMQERAAALGYDWPDIEGVLDKVAEELGELAARRDERGAAGGVRRPAARRRSTSGASSGIESEAALRAANHKFRVRFRRVERMVARARRRPARPGFRGTRRAVGCCQGRGTRCDRSPTAAVGSEGER